MLLSDSGCFQPDVRSWKSGPACLPACLPPGCLAARLLCPRLYRGSHFNLFPATPGLKGMLLSDRGTSKSLSESVRSIRIPSQIAVDCKSVHCWPELALGQPRIRIHLCVCHLFVLTRIELWNSSTDTQANGGSRQYNIVTVKHTPGSGQHC